MIVDSATPTHLMPPSKAQRNLGTGPRPAHKTKQEETLVYPFLSSTFQLRQLDNGQSNGTGLWLGAQCLSLYLADVNSTLTKAANHRIKHSDSKDRRPRAIELGSGVGLGALALASTGWDVLATDTAYITSSVLRPNITANSGIVTPQDVQSRELDWTVEPRDWTWTHQDHVACLIADDPQRTSESKLVEKSESGQSPVLSGIRLSPPFDLIITSDTIFSVDLTPHLIRTIHHLCRSSGVQTKASDAIQYPPVYLALENRDPITTDRALDEAKNTWGFSLTRIPNNKVNAAMRRGGVDWTEDEWEGVEIWKLMLS